ncbi:hypothetical protein GTA62_14580 [Roseobacter sp. HKCCD9010]|uniref:siphovirus Gp157 family protein n=1 Tax=unclassified Roseobacter TaxID=196798 RepID=UPI001490DDC6|nr:MULTISPECIES: siphovirus Gp157 family protein [unclassified Roseobacter]MBF9050664.1 hypothetical protein [Rhodobacterales bacterium HKCCD4356]NNV11918.1 hypothetical protein [Roseobacter sp. HKCCD7357]NNV16931.1 hypothetical protein [Roseobacter sp. HKCCD8768]NNV26160.1 hypothetical protein [Roseobacter sp. HKCCD8192]NNV30652.1 hypothetical protein [Roseobacter sp. HKCCD9061]
MKHIDANTIASVAQMIRDMCGDDLDDMTLLDTLDGEIDTGDLLDALIADERAAEAMQKAIADQMKGMAERKERFARRQAASRSAMMRVMEAAGVRKAERPRATISLAVGRTKVDITDLETVPTQLCQMKKQPDRTAIKKALEAGETVPGAELVTGGDTLTVRAS